MPILIGIFIVVPIVEIWLIVQVGQLIGVLPTIALLVADSILGSYLLANQGRAAWARFNRALAEHRIPQNEVIDGVLIIFGGALLLTPGFFTDIIGLLLLIPLSRALMRKFLVTRASNRFQAGKTFIFRATPQNQSRTTYDVDATAYEEGQPEPKQLERR